MDKTLLYFIYLAEFERLSFSVTLYVKGIIISGYIVGGNEYVEILRENMKKMSPDSDTNEKYFSPYFDNILQDYERRRKIVIENPEDRTLYDPLYEDFIHLKNIEIRHGGKPIILKESAWRGSLATVDAFSFGMIETISPAN